MSRTLWPGPGRPRRPGTVTSRRLRRAYDLRQTVYATSLRCPRDRRGTARRLRPIRHPARPVRRRVRRPRGRVRLHLRRRPPGLPGRRAAVRPGLAGLARRRPRPAARAPGLAGRGRAVRRGAERLLVRRLGSRARRTTRPRSPPPGPPWSPCPRLVPVYSHRYLPAGRGASGHPVLSVMQTDIICYGADLDDYLYREFGLGAAGDKPCRPTVMFWSLLASVASLRSWARCGVCPRASRPPGRSGWCGPPRSGPGRASAVPACAAAHGSASPSRPGAVRTVKSAGLTLSRSCPGDREGHRDARPDPRAVGGHHGRPAGPGRVQEHLAVPVLADERGGGQLRVEALGAGRDRPGRGGHVVGRGAVERHEDVHALGAAGLHRAAHARRRRAPA